MEQFKVNERVYHPTYGEGVIRSRSGSGDDLRLQVVFDDHGTKTLAARYANLVNAKEMHTTLRAHDVAKTSNLPAPVPNPPKSKHSVDLDAFKKDCEAGMAHKELSDKYGIPRGSIGWWMKKVGFERSDEALAVKTEPQEAIVERPEGLCKCGCGETTFQYNGYVWGHKNKKPPEVVTAQPTSRRVSVVKSTHQEMTVEENHDGELRAHVDQAIAAIDTKIDKLQKAINIKPYDFWLDGEEISNDISEDVALLWGAKVPEQVLNAIWYSLTAQAKANLLSAIAVSRYKERPPQQS